MTFKKTGDIVKHFEYREATGGLPLVFANSLGTDFRIWDLLIDKLDDRRPMVRYDKRGHGLTDVTPGPYSIAGLADDLINLLDQLGVSQAIFVGLSIGGMITQQISQIRPDLVRGIVLMDTAHKIGTAEMWQQRIAAIHEGGIAPNSDSILQRWFTQKFREDRSNDLAGWRNMLVRTPVEGYIACCEAIKMADLSDAAKAISVPTLCLVGDEDGSTPPDVVRSLADLIQDARFQIIEGAGHIPGVEQPDAVAKTINDFLADTGL